MGPRVSSYMTRQVYTVRPEEPLSRARKLMLSKNIGRLVVVDESNRVEGIITVSDVADALVNRYPSRPADLIRIGEVMTRDPITVEPTRTVRTAASTMLKYGVGGLPVVNSLGELSGIITRTDLLKAFASKYAGSFTVGDMMRRDFSTVNPGHSVFYVSRLVSVDPAGKVLVVDENGKLLGVIAKRDLAFLATPIRRGPSFIKGRGGTRFYTIQLAEDIMTPNPITVEPDMDAAEAAALMYRERIGVLPVVDGGELVGVFSKLEVVRALASMKR